MVLEELVALAQRGRLVVLLPACRRYLAEVDEKGNGLIDVGVLLARFGFLGEARKCLESACLLAPGDIRPLANLAKLAHDAGAPAEAHRLYMDLLARFPCHPAIRRNVLMGLEYDPSVTDDVRLMHAKAWGKWAFPPFSIPAISL